MVDILEPLSSRLLVTAAKGQNQVRANVPRSQNPWARRKGGAIQERIETDRSDEHIQKADLPRLEIVQPDSSVKSERFRQSKKHHRQIV
jgi:hypothetical protein